MIRSGELVESFRIAFESLRVNLMRSMLTTAGVVVGVVLVVLMGWTINGLDAVWEQTISIIGKDMIYVDKWNWAGGGNWRKTMSRKDITLDQVTLFAQRAEAPQLTIPTIRSWGGSVTVGNQSLRCSVLGVTSDYGLTPAGEIADGRFFNAVEDEHAADVIVIGHGVSKTLFPNGDAVGRTLKINGRPLRIVGVVEKRGFLFMDFIDNQVFLPLTTFRAVYGFAGRSFSIALKAGNERMLDVVRDEAVGLMREIRNVPPHVEDDFSINEMKAFDAQAKNIRLYIWIVGIGLTVLAFIVGSIGIMNIMFVSVTERTKEIGIRKAIGARRSTIAAQFLIESTVLCLTGAIIAFPISQLIVGTARWMAVSVFDFEAASVVSPFIPVDLLGIAAGVAAIVGLVAGLVPAVKAALLNPVEALRFE